MKEIPAQFVQILQQLTNHKTEFVLVGGLAMVLHGTDTATFDVDISFALDLENCEKVCQFVNAHHPRPLAFPTNTHFQVTPGLLMRAKFVNLKTDLGAIDLLPLPDGVDSFAGLLARAEMKDLGDFSVPVASVDDLIAMKKAANRIKDQLHVLELYALQRVLRETPPT